MLVILRMNRDSMEFMRTNYPDVARKLADQHFGFTPIPDEQTKAAHKPSTSEPGPSGVEPASATEEL